MNDTNTVGTTGKTVNEIVADWENTPMTKAEIVKHFVEHLKLDEEILAREIEETEKWKRDVLTLQKQNEQTTRIAKLIVEKKDKEIQELEKRSSNLVQSIKNLKCERNHDIELGV